MCTNILAHGEIQLHVCGIFAATELFWRKIAILVSIELCLHRIAWQLAKQVGGAVTLTRARYEYPQVHMFHELLNGRRALSRPLPTGMQMARLFGRVDFISGGRKHKNCWGAEVHSH